MAQLQVRMENVSMGSVVGVNHSVDEPIDSLNSSIMEGGRHVTAVEFDSMDPLSRFESLHGREMCAESYLSMPPLSMRHLNAMGEDRTPGHTFVWRMNQYFDRFKRCIFFNSMYACLIMLVIALVFGLNSFTLDYWRRNVVNYSSADVIGSSMTVLGTHHLNRIDKVMTSNSTAIELTKEISYVDVASSAYCGSNIDTLRTSSSTLELQLFRTIEKIGLLDLNGEEDFVGVHGHTVYDVLCSQVDNIATAGKIMLVMGLLSYVMFALMSYVVIKRLCFPHISRRSDIARLISNICNVVWVTSIALGLIGFVAYVVCSEGPACVDYTGTPTKCPLYISAYFFMAYLCGNVLCFVSYLLYGRGLSLDRSDITQLKF